MARPELIGKRSLLETCEVVNILFMLPEIPPSIEMNAVYIEDCR